MDERRSKPNEMENAFPFCDQLEKFIKYIGGMKELSFITYDYPNLLKNRLDDNIGELEIVLAEVKAAAENAERLRFQRNCIKKEKIALKKSLKRMKDDEIREMECVISLYDKPMFSRWENVKSTERPEVLEGILSDIKGKQIALENLNILVTRRLNQIQAFKPILGNEAENNRSGLIREKTAIPLPFPSFCPPIPPPPPPPLPPPPVFASYLPKRSHAQRLSVQRRRRLERREENLERRCVVAAAANADDLSLVPLTFGELPGSFLSTIMSGSSSSSQDVVADPELPLSNNENGGNEAVETPGFGIEFQSEMRSVLQALFGELRSTPTVPQTGNAELDIAANEDREIELHSVEKRQ